MYLKLTVELYLMVFSNLKKLIKINQEILLELGLSKKLFPRVEYLKLAFVVVIKTPYFILIKPMKQFYHSKSMYKGCYSKYNGNIDLDNYDIVRKTKYYLFGLPLWYSNSSEMEEKDWEIILK
jgi:hypothetical protein